MSDYAVTYLADTSIVIAGVLAAAWVLVTIIRRWKGSNR